MALARATKNDLYFALARTVRQQLMSRWLETLGAQMQAKAKVVAYLSAEYLLGRQLDNALLASGLTEIAEKSMAGLGIDLNTAARRRGRAGPGQRRPRPAGRLLHRFAGHHADPGRRLRHPLRVRHFPADLRRRRAGRAARLVAGQRLAVGVPAPGDGGQGPVRRARPSSTRTTDGVTRSRWNHGWEVIGIPYNYMVPGYRTGSVNTLRLWSAKATQAFDLQVFNTGDYLQAVRSQAFAENISKVLYPEDSTPQGKELRLQQQYFFVACSIRDYIDNVLPPGFDLQRLPERVIFQLNDTHPVIAIPELIRILVDERGHGLGRGAGTSPGSASPTPATPCCPRPSRCGRSTCSAGCCRGTWRSSTGSTTNSWPSCARPTPTTSSGCGGCRSSRSTPSGRCGWPTWPPSADPRSTASRSCTASCCGTRCCRTSPTTGRRSSPTSPTASPRGGSSALANPGLSGLITDTIGDGWLSRSGAAARIGAATPMTTASWTRSPRSRRRNKTRLATLLQRRDGIALPEDALYDVMVKRLHEYKRQTLKLLHIITLYQRIQENPDIDLVPRVTIFGAKAAPGYRIAKDTIALINAVARVLDADPMVAGRLRIAFPANYNVTLAETLIPAADLSEQISLAGKEASGTGNMKLALNGALTIGTLDGANVEILQPGRRGELLPVRAHRAARCSRWSTPATSPEQHYESNPACARRSRRSRPASSPTATGRRSPRWSTRWSTTTGSSPWPTTRPTSTRRIWSRSPTGTSGPGPAARC